MRGGEAAAPGCGLQSGASRGRQRSVAVLLLSTVGSRSVTSVIRANTDNRVLLRSFSQKFGVLEPLQECFFGESVVLKLKVYHVESFLMGKN